MPTPLHVLIVDDFADDAELITHTLRQAGYTVQWQIAASKAEYLAKLSPTFDVIIADYDLPNYDALQALADLQARGLDIPFIVVTGSVSEELVVECLRRGAYDYLLKDRLSRLGQAVEHAIQVRHIQLEKARAERERDALVRQMQAVIENVMDGILIADENGIIVRVNPAILKLFGYTQESLIGRSVELLMNKVDATQHDSYMQRYIQNGVPHIIGKSREVIAKRADGTHFMIDLSISEIYLDGRRFFLATMHDVTERKQMEEARLTAEILQVELEKEKDLRQLRSRLISMITHDLRNPLASMRLAADMLTDYFDKMSVEQRTARLSAIKQGIARLNAIVDDVLALGEAEAGKLRCQPQLGDFAAHCHTIFRDFVSTLGSEHRLSYEGAQRDLVLPFDAKLIEQVLLNLLGNAVKYSPKGSPIVVSLAADTNQAVLQVSDSGIGIPPEDQKRLFEAFHRAGNVGGVRGTGLGLAITKLIVELHNGSISFESALGKGTIFYVRLPRSVNEST
ncbi:MAG: PAS domain S-box protein [Chloroflexi bacterium CFX4]|nr:PAS domain S-box protein [Chloroflexi bacterium CFX4]